MTSIFSNSNPEPLGRQSSERPSTPTTPFQCFTNGPSKCNNARPSVIGPLAFWAECKSLRMDSTVFLARVQPFKNSSHRCSKGNIRLLVLQSASFTSLIFSQLLALLCKCLTTDRSSHLQIRGTLILKLLEGLRIARLRYPLSLPT